MALGRKPKDVTKFLHPAIAYMRLANAALEHVLCNRHGTRVQWTLKVTFWHNADYKPAAGQVAVRGGFTLSSGDDSPEFETALTGKPCAPETDTDTEATTPESEQDQ